MIKIGIIAGEILSLIERENRPMSIHDICYRLDRPKEVVAMGVGCLTREAITKVEIKNNGFIVTKLNKK